MNKDIVIQYVSMTAEHVEETCNVVGRSFTKEPMTEALHLNYEQVRSDFAKVVEEIGPKGFSTVAIDPSNGKIVGCCLNKDFTMQPMGDDAGHSDALAVFDLVDELDETVPELKALKPGDMFHLYILAVDSDYGKLDIGLNLTIKAEEIGRAGNFKQILSEVTGPVSQHIMRDTRGFEVIGRVKYGDFLYHGEKVFEGIEACESCLLVRKDLN
jgi:ribosomal protein S18 acetylase RimI-like enzyme